jgi:hypothetical protein
VNSLGLTCYFGEGIPLVYDRALAERLALQGVNIVLVALDDGLLKDTHAALTSQFPNLKVWFEIFV